MRSLWMLSACAAFVVAAGGFAGCGGNEVAPSGTLPVEASPGAPDADGGPVSVQPEAGPDGDGSSAESAPSEASDAPPEASADAPSDADASDWQSCRGPGDCVLAVRGCCGSFYIPEYYAAIQRDKVQAFAKSVCPTFPTTGGCDASVVFNDRLLAYCIDGRCKVVDVPNDPISACSAPEDCAAVSSRCDGSCGYFSGMLAIRADQLATFAEQWCPALDASSFVCAPNDGGAPKEGGTPARAECAADGHCKARFP